MLTPLRPALPEGNCGVDVLSHEYSCSEWEIGARMSKDPQVPDSTIASPKALLASQLDCHSIRQKDRGSSVPSLIATDERTCTTRSEAPESKPCGQMTRGVPVPQLGDAGH